MKYVGSKNKLSKYLVPIIQSYIDNNHIENYLEPFVGGANIIDKIQCKNKYGYDIHKELIALLQVAQTSKIFPNTITEEEYYYVKNHPEQFADWYVGLVGFCATFGSKYFGGYARGFKEDKITLRDIPNEAIRNLEKQRVNFKNIQFNVIDFREIKDLKNYVIYCDPPYENTTEYKTDKFPHKEFWEWCREQSKNNIVLISEYNAPNDFECIWEKEHETTLQVVKHDKRIEKLFIKK